MQAVVEKEIIIRKVEITPSNIVKMDVGEKIGAEEDSVKKSHEKRPHPDFKNAVQSFSIHALRVLLKDLKPDGLYSDSYEDNPGISAMLSNISVSSVSLKGQGTNEGIEIVYKLSSVDGHVNKITSPKIRLDEESSPYQYASDLLTDWEALEEEATLYYKKEKFDSENEPDGQKSLFDKDKMEDVNTDTETVAAAGAEVVAAGSFNNIGEQVAAGASSDDDDDPF